MRTPTGGDSKAASSVGNGLGGPAEKGSSWKDDSDSDSMELEDNVMDADPDSPPAFAVPSPSVVATMSEPVATEQMLSAACDELAKAEDELTKLRHLESGLRINRSSFRRGAHGHSL